MTPTLTTIETGSCPEPKREREFEGMLPDMFIRVRATSEGEAQQLIIEEIIRRLRAEPDHVIITN